MTTWAQRRGRSGRRAGRLASTAATVTALVGGSMLAPASPAAAVPEDRSGPGVIRGSTWYVSETFTPRHDVSFVMGRPTDWPLIGDWDGDGLKTPGVWRDGKFYLNNDFGPGHDYLVGLGRPGDRPVVGDWDGDGDDDVAVVRGNRWHIDLNLSGGAGERSFQLGRSTDVPVAGDWDGTADGSVADDAGVVRDGYRWYLKDDTITTGNVTAAFPYGRPGDYPVVGRWTPGSASDNVGVVRGSRWLLDAQLGQGLHDIEFLLGRSSDLPMTWGRSGSVVHQPTYTVTYSVRARGGVTSDLGVFAETARQTLGHTLGWSMGGQVRFVQVPRGGDFTLWLATPAAVDAASSGCSATYSCRVGDDVYINEERWEEATPTWDSRPLRDYRYYVINHEVGHWLEVGHRNDCPAPGGPAPVMMQQSIRLYGGCSTNIWPLPSEKREALRDRLS